MVTDALHCGLPWKYGDYTWLLMLSLTHVMLMSMVLAGFLRSFVD